ncbi:ATP-binding cassette domain-containing protein [Adhaeribacter soli]|uniref:ATP-binding cassette domain-containing protein n=1 Tax=Adhaeribacter soli TaxID=2607655 RepID=A0A5N1IRW3_9BACT|nr:ATP-binding cassette domain-containing protein [Adhaeribacter soli]KAA9332784.1 ATP-binding cassette domain-containing protein [Adhaeribacter soli]
MIEIHNLNLAFGRKPVLQNLNISFEKGKVHGIIGLNGAGKSSFFNALTQVIPPDSGSIRFNGNALKRGRIGYLETNNFFFFHLTGREYLHIFEQTNTAFDLPAFEKLLLLPLDDLVENYSTGMKKKLALLAVLKQDKPIYIFDEPFNGLDLESNRTLELIIQTLQEKGKTILLSSHVLEPLLHTCNQIHLLQNGSFVKSYEQPDFGRIREELFQHLEVEIRNQLQQAL